jgi:hypothetical protein
MMTLNPSRKWKISPQWQRQETWMTNDQRSYTTCFTFINNRGYLYEDYISDTTDGSFRFHYSVLFPTNGTPVWRDIKDLTQDDAKFLLEYPDSWRMEQLL